MQPQIIELFDLAENDLGELLLALPDSGVDSDGAKYQLEQDTIILTYPDQRIYHLPNVPASAHTTLRAGREILVVEASEDQLVRSYYAKPFAPMLRPKTRNRL